MSYTEQLAQWAEEERKKGLVHINFFLGTRRDGSLEAAARSVLEALNSDDWIDITHEPL